MEKELVIGIDVGGQSTKLGVVNKDGEIIAQTVISSLQDELIDYINEQNAKGNNLHGGIIKNDQYGNWIYCPLKIEDACDTSGWSIFDPHNA